MKKIAYVWFAAFALSVLLLGTTAEAKVTVADTTVYSFSLAPEADLSVRNVNGGIVIRGWDKDSARVTVEKIVTASRSSVARHFLREVEINFDSDETHLDIEPKLPKGANGNWNFFDWIFGTGERAKVRVNFVILVPRKLNAEVENVNGRIDIKDLAGELDVKCTNGRVTLENVTGDISAKTVNGRLRVKISDARALDDLTLKTINGSVTVWLPNDIGGKVDLGTLNGSITTDFPLELRGKIAKHEMRGRIGKGHSRIRINTLNGSIRLLKQNPEEK